MNSQQGRDAKALYEMRQQQRSDTVSPGMWLFAAVMVLLVCAACCGILYFVFGGF